MARSSHPSLPPGTESSLRRLGSGKGGGERPLRAQLVIAGALLLILLAVPLYLLRRPSGVSSPEGDETRHFGGVVRAEVDASAPPSGVLVGSIQRVRCGASASRAPNEGGMCDALPVLEAAFRRSIGASADCAPRTGKEGSINYVLEVDFSDNHVNVFPGKSGKWRGPQARRAAACVLRAFPEVAWEGLPHQHEYYAIAILATYPAPDPLDVLPSFD